MDQNIAPDFAPRKERMNIGLRLAGGLLDHMIFTFGMTILLAPFMVFSLMASISEDRAPVGFSLPIFIAFAFFYAIYLSKDAFNGRSPAKRIVKTQVLDFKTGLPAKPLRCVVRNLTILFWPMEVIAILINPKRRVGDYLAGTQVEYADMPQRRPANAGQIVLAFLIALLFCLAFSLPFYFLSELVFSHNQEVMGQLNSRY